MSQILISDFTKKVLTEIKSIPSGKIATYKQIAVLAGKPQGSRGVAWILHSCSTLYKLPWHRVINSQGRISFDKQSSNFRLQKKRLLSEGVDVSIEGHLSLVKFQWKKKPIQKKISNREPKLFR